MQSWDEVRRWRRERRGELIARRQASRRTSATVCSRGFWISWSSIPCPLSSALLGFYWPFWGEIGNHPLVRRLVERGARAALPVVVEKEQPLEFSAWRPVSPLRRGVWDIPIPVERQVVRPTALLVPLVGFDRRGYRLGYGGGYYDRPLAAMDPRPLTVGIGYEIGCLESIHPQPHDIPRHAIVTEAGLVRPRSDRDVAPRLPTSVADVDEDPNSRATYASPPCFIHELEPAYVGFMPDRDRPTANLDEPAATRRDPETE